MLIFKLILLQTMLRALFFFTPCAIAGYLAYPYLNQEGAEEKVRSQLNILLLNSVSTEEVVGSWALSPRSTALIAHSRGTSGKRLGLSLESWGGGEANFSAGGFNIEGPISWDMKPGMGRKPATLNISSGSEDFTLQFSKVNDGLVLIAETDSKIPGQIEHIRFLKAR